MNLSGSLSHWCAQRVLNQYIFTKKWKCYAKVKSGVTLHHNLLIPSTPNAWTVSKPQPTQEQKKWVKLSLWSAQSSSVSQHWTITSVSAHFSCHTFPKQWKTIFFISKRVCSYSGVTALEISLSFISIFSSFQTDKKDEKKSYHLQNCCICSPLDCTLRPRPCE